ncbi:hypothetical protein [Agromyces sp. NPDC056965]|uniref:hypothetical protein n=1 Tax=Agromyces sp. NPDC056965 TaxID=3345983 RepID=UPI003633CBFF
MRNTRSAISSVAIRLTLADGRSSVLDVDPAPPYRVQFRDGFDDFVDPGTREVLIQGVLSALRFEAGTRDAGS